MKCSSLTAAVVALVTAANISSALAQEVQPAAQSICSTISQRADPGSSNPSTIAAHYEYQYGYDHHSKWRGHWVLVR